jgi:2-polyprenyl-3-methyl-5-hydroxy-6-metoxy-1,4-benzoquinol methylase
MNYQKQQILFRRYRTVATICAIFILCANLALILTGARDLKQGTVLLALSAAISFLLYYLPTYLGLTVEPEKRYRWAIRIRWIITGVLLIAGLIFVRTPFQLAHLFLTILALAVVNLIVRRLYKGGKKNAPWIYLISDLILLLTWVNNLGTAATAIVLQSVLLLYTSLSYNTEARWERARSIGLVLLASGFGFLTFAIVTLGQERVLFLSAGLLLITVGIFRLLTGFVSNWNQQNIVKTTREIAKFNNIDEKRSLERIRTASDELATDWLRVNPASPSEVESWYRRNSSLYIYDLAGFHLYGKHIRFTMDLIDLARGRVLDYGAGNGDLCLELARRGHRTVYFDLEGETKRFVEWRAKNYKIKDIEFYSQRNLIRGRFDTIYSLDVLEHLLDPMDALNFLLERLEFGGKLIITAPFGSTDSHPMHFSHNLDAEKYLEEKGLVPAKGRLGWTGSSMMRKKHVLVYKRPLDNVARIA